MIEAGFRALTIGRYGRTKGSHAAAADDYVVRFLNSFHIVLNILCTRQRLRTTSQPSKIVSSGSQLCEGLKRG